MSTVFVYQAEDAISKAGRPYIRQSVQVIQAPKRRDVFTYHFPESKADVLEPGKYTCDMYLRDSMQGPKVAFENFEKVD